MPDEPISIEMIRARTDWVPHPSSRSWRQEAGDFDFPTLTVIESCSVYNPPMSLVEQIQKDIVTAMKAKDEARLSTLRMVKSALQLQARSKKWRRSTTKNPRPCCPR